MSAESDQKAVADAKILPLKSVSSSILQVGNIILNAACILYKTSDYAVWKYYNNIMAKNRATTTESLGYYTYLRVENASRVLQYYFIDYILLLYRPSIVGALSQLCHITVCVKGYQGVEL